ncbi:MAG TPA: response regulator transcription factor [Acidimicrobiia bacterium]|nr:response regulator transcription factor [Acidimicrobiia bacterium]
MASRILAVEDDTRIRAVIRLALEEEGYDVIEADSAEEALELFATSDPDVVLVDLMLPGRNGFDLCRDLRRSSDVPIIMVTARNDTHDVVAGLEAGADDYVVKPFVVKELAARIRSSLRRSRRTEGGNERLVFGDLDIRPDAGVVLMGENEVSLTKTEFRLLCELAQHAGMVLSREQLLERVWNYDYFGDTRVVDAHIRRLRTKVERDPSEPEHIVTVRGLGYRMQT